MLTYLRHLTHPDDRVVVALMTAARRDQRTGGCEGTRVAPMFVEEAISRAEQQDVVWGPLLARVERLVDGRSRRTVQAWQRHVEALCDHVEAYDSMPLTEALNRYRRSPAVRLAIASHSRHAPTGIVVAAVEDVVVAPPPGTELIFGPDGPPLWREDRLSRGPCLCGPSADALLAHTLVRGAWVSDSCPRHWTRTLQIARRLRRRGAVIPGPMLATVVHALHDTFGIRNQNAPKASPARGDMVRVLIEELVTEHAQREGGIDPEHFASLVEIGGEWGTLVVGLVAAPQPPSRHA